MSNRLDQEREKQLTPKRVAFAVNALECLGYKPVVQNNNTITFDYKGGKVTLYPYSGWHTGKTIKDGRGIEKLLKQLTDKEDNNG